MWFVVPLFCLFLLGSQCLFDVIAVIIQCCCAGRCWSLLVETLSVYLLVTKVWPGGNGFLAFLIFAVPFDLCPCLRGVSAH